MFTGIIQGRGTVGSIERPADAARLVIDCGLDTSDWQVGDSVAVNGVCLTAISIEAGRFSADVSSETLSRTTLGSLENGSDVNLEPALRFGNRLGGHLVTGHVDGVARVVERRPAGDDSIRFAVRVPEHLSRYIATKGSVCVDGVSLTVNQVAGTVFHVQIVPHTLSVTNINGYRVGTAVNIEVDLIARYLERLNTDQETESSVESSVVKVVSESCFSKDTGGSNFRISENCSPTPLSDTTFSSSGNE